MGKLYEVSALVRYAIVLYADSPEQALKHVETWDEAWHGNAALIGASDVEIVAVRDGEPDEAHEDVTAAKEA